jgi:hypothetical protein
MTGKYSITIKFTAPNSGVADVLTESVYGDVGSATISAGQSYMKSSASGSWTDLKTLIDDPRYDLDGLGNVSVRAFLDPVDVSSMALHETVGPKTAYYVGDALDRTQGKITVSYSDGYTEDIALSDPAVKITGFDSGAPVEDQDITVEYLGYYDHYQITVSEKPIVVAPVKQVTSIRAPLTTIYMKKGTSYTLPVVAYSGSAQMTAKLTYKSSNTKVLTVSAAGKLTAKSVKKKTKVKVTVKAPNGVSRVVTIYVVPKSKAFSKAKVSGVPSSMNIGAVASITARPNATTATNVKVTFSSSNSGVLKVDKAGRLTAVKAGQAKITVKVGSKKWTKIITVR